MATETVDWTEYNRRLALREARRAEVHRLLGFTDAPYQPVKRNHEPGTRKPAEAVGRGGRRPVAWAPTKRRKRRS